MQFNITKEEIQKAIAEGQARRAEYLAQSATAVSRETYDEMLEVLPPLIWDQTGQISHLGPIRYFVMSEFQDGDITACYASRNNNGTEEHICKYVAALSVEVDDVEESRVTQGLPTHADFDDVQHEIDAITSIESKIYGEGNEAMLHACGYVKENYLSGKEATMIRAFEVIEETGCLRYGSAADIAYDYIEPLMEKNTLDWFFRYFDHEGYLQDIEFEEIAHEVWIHGPSI